MFFIAHTFISTRLGPIAGGFDQGEDSRHVPMKWQTEQTMTDAGHSGSM